MEKKRLAFVFSIPRLIFCMAGIFLLFQGMQKIQKDFTWEQSSLQGIFHLDLLMLAGLCYRVRLSERWAACYRVLLLIIAPIYCFWEIEYVRGYTFSNMKFLFAALNYLLILTVFLILYAVTNRFGLTMVLGLTIFTFYGLLYAFIKEFRGNGLRAADIYAWRTAANVSGSYSIVFTEDMCKVVLYALALALLCCLVECKNRFRDRFLITAVCMVFVTGLTSVFYDTDFMEKNGVKPYLWELSASEKDHGALLDFIAGMPDLKMKKPEGYLAEEAKAAEKKRSSISGEGLHVQTLEEHKKPHIIAIMNEAFSDFRTLGAIETDQPVLENWDLMQENVIKGKVSVPVFGGWTANSEFEFLTGFANAFLPNGVVPFQTYVREGMPNLNEILKNEDYTSIFMHPMQDSGWNRKSVYQTLKFDQMYYKDEFGKVGIRGYVTDETDYRTLIEKYEQNKKNGPVFLFNVTIQNHGGYMGGSFPQMIQILNREEDYPQAEEYLTLVRESDRSFRELLNYFSQEEEPVVVCMFGDHYPKVEEGLYHALLNDKEGVQKTALQYQVPFMIFTNYDIEEKEYENISLNYLSTLLCNTAGIPLDPYQKYLAAMYEEFPVVNVYGVKRKDGQWYTWEEAMQFPEIQEYNLVQYRNLFDKK